MIVNKAKYTADKLFKDYLNARLIIADKKITDSNPYLKGNDNIIGRLGEYIAMLFLEIELNVEVEKTKGKSDKNYDIKYNHNGDYNLVNVKIITHENETGRTSRITGVWDDLIIIELGEAYKILRIGWLKRCDFDKIQKDNAEFPSKTPYAKRSMLNCGGTIGKHGRVYSREFLEKEEKYKSLFDFE